MENVKSNDRTLRRVMQFFKRYRIGKRLRRLLGGAWLVVNKISAAIVALLSKRSGAVSIMLVGLVVAAVLLQVPLVGKFCGMLAVCLSAIAALLHTIKESLERSPEKS